MWTCPICAVENEGTDFCISCGYVPLADELEELQDAERSDDD
jgi:hypothetical protein